MDSIFHEKQEGSLCAQHCLNSLLQGQYFTAVDLADIARQIDEEERFRMAEGGTQSYEYKKYLQQPSQNMDDSGFFSIQVIETALKVWNLELVPISSPRASQAKTNPQYQNAFICNLQEHWFTIRKFGYQWFNLNSVKSGPELITDTYLDMYLAQLLQEGYSIFVVIGDLPKCIADQVLRDNPISWTAFKLEQQKQAQSKSSKQTPKFVSKDNLDAALAATSTSEPDDYPDPSTMPDPVDLDEIRRKRLIHFERQNPTNTNLSKDHDLHHNNNEEKIIDYETEDTNDEMLQAAIKMSLEADT